MQFNKKTRPQFVDFPLEENPIVERIHKDIDLFIATIHEQIMFASWERSLKNDETTTVREVLSKLKSGTVLNVKIGPKIQLYDVVFIDSYKGYFVWKEKEIVKSPRFIRESEITKIFIADQESSSVPIHKDYLAMTRYEIEQRIGGQSVRIDNENWPHIEPAFGNRVKIVSNNGKPRGEYYFLGKHRGSIICRKTGGHNSVALFSVDKFVMINIGEPCYFKPDRLRPLLDKTKKLLDKVEEVRIRRLRLLAIERIQLLLSNPDLIQNLIGRKFDIVVDGETIKNMILVQVYRDFVAFKSYSINSTFRFGEICAFEIEDVENMIFSADPFLGYNDSVRITDDDILQAMYEIDEMS